MGASASWFFFSLLFTAFLGHVHSFARPEDLHIAKDDRLFHFVTRPEIRASRWTFTTNYPDQVTPGYWFVGPYEILDQPPEVGEPGWIGPHIYDNQGELVWGGASMFDNRNVEDFRISNVNGRDLMTLLFQETGQGALINETYQIVEDPQIDDASNVNTHEFNFVQNGTRVLVIKNDEREASREQSEEIGFDGNCVAEYEHFQELDTETWEVVFDWDSKDHIRLNESTLTDESVEDRCWGWDFFHSNSVDKTPDGDYLLSARHTDTIYKVSGDDGHIIWRLGGNMSDFGSGNWTFSRQHDVRFQDQNATHLVLSVLDNAKGIDSQEPTYPYSRGLFLALNEEEMTATMLRQIDHPEGEGSYAPRRGDVQLLPNGNVFMGWSEFGSQSEHAPNGTLLMYSFLTADWLGSYRNYKFNFTGRPTEKPAVHSIAFPTDGGSSATVVHVSWNGDTETAYWKMYRTTVDGEDQVLAGSARRTGFETVVEYGGLANYVLLKALDKKGNVLAESDVIKTTTPLNVHFNRLFREPFLLFCLGAVSGGIFALVLGIVCRGGLPKVNIPKWIRGTSRYEKLDGGDAGQDVALERLKHWKPDEEEAQPLRPPSSESLDFGIADPGK